MNNILKLGGILGLVSLLSTIIYKYVLGYEFLFSWKSMLVGLVITIAIAVVLGRKFFRDPEDGTLSYGEAVKNLFLSFLISFVVSMLGSTLLFGNDVELGQAYKDYTISTAEATARSVGEMTGQSEADIEASVEGLRAQYESGEMMLPDNPFSFSMLPMNLLSGAIYSIIIALILAIFVKKRDGMSHA